jgi:hypothetical protein
MAYLGTYVTDEDAARVYDFAALSLRGVGKPGVINFDKGAYLGPDGALLPVEAALPGLGRDEHKYVRDKLAAAVVGAGGAAEGASDGGSESDSGGSAGPSIPARVRTRPGSAALGAQPPARRRGPASAASDKPGGHTQAPGAQQQGTAAPRLPPHQPLPRVQQAQQPQASQPRPTAPHRCAHQPLPLVPSTHLPPPQQAQQPLAAPPPPPPHQPLTQAPQPQPAQQQQQQLPPAPPPPPPHQPESQAQQQVPPAQQAHEAPPAVGSAHDFHTRAAALAFLRELHAASNEGALPLDVYHTGSLTFHPSY